jgi:hypothetical protein
MITGLGINTGYKVNAMLFTDSTQLITIHRFMSADEAMNYYNHLKQDESPLRRYSDKDHTEYAISTQNYATFYNRKDPSAYAPFFDKYYLKRKKLLRKAQQLLILFTLVMELPTFEVALFRSIHDGLIDTLLVDGTHAGSRNLQHNPLIPFRNIELLDFQIRLKRSLGLLVGVGNIVSVHDLFSCNLTNF